VLDVVVYWRDDVVAWRRVERGSSAALGAHPQALAPIPCPPEVKAGFIVAQASDDAATAFVPEAALAILRRGREVSLVDGPATLALGAGDRAEIVLGEFRIAVLADLPQTMPRAPRSPSTALGGVALAAVMHLTALGLAAQEARADVDREEERTSTLRGLLASAEVRARGNDTVLQDGTGKGESAEVNDMPGDGRAGGGARARGEAGKMGDRLARPDVAKRFAIPAFDKRSAPSASRAKVLADASQFGVIGLLGQGPAAPSAPFAADVSHLAGRLAANGALWGRDLGASSGAGGLELSGTGEGGGGRTESIGLGSAGTLGHTSGRQGTWLGGRGSRPPRKERPAVVRYGDGTSVSSRYPPEAIRHVIRHNFGLFRGCYQKGLLRNPNLQGRVSVRFVIDRDGSVRSAEDAGSDLPDREVVACVVRGFYALHFSATEGGIVTVTYPIVFSPGRAETPPQDLSSAIPLFTMRARPRARVPGPPP
jgi:hypothetical protein